MHLDYVLEISMRAKPESTVISKKSSASNLIVLVESEIIDFLAFC